MGKGMAWLVDFNTGGVATSRVNGKAKLVKSEFPKGLLSVANAVIASDRKAIP